MKTICRACCIILFLSVFCSCKRQQENPSQETAGISFFSDMAASSEKVIVSATPLPAQTPKLVAPFSYGQKRPASDQFKLHISPQNTTVLLMQQDNILFQTNQIPESGILMPNLPDGDYEILLNAPGYDIYKDTVSIRRGKAPAYFSLHPLQGELNIKSGAHVHVLVTDTNNSEIFTGETTLYGILETDLPEGHFVLHLSKTNHYSVMREIDIEQGNPARIQAALKPIPGRIWVASSRTAEVWEDNRQLGTTGTVISNLVAGKHQFTIKSQGYRPQTMTVEIPPNTYLPLVAPALSPAQGAVSITVTSSVPNDQWFDGLEKTITLSPQDCQRIRKSILFRDVRCGIYNVQATVPGYRMADSNSTVTVEDNQTNTLQIVMEPLPIKIQINCIPRDANLYAGTRKIGPCNSAYLVPPFTNILLRIHRDDYVDATVTVPALPPDSQTNYNIMLEPEIRLEDLVINFNAEYASVNELSSGSLEALMRQQQTARKTGLSLEVRTAKTGIPLRLIPPGRFYMGSPFSEEGRERDEAGPLSDEALDPLVEVILTEPFYVGKTEVTQAQWIRVMGDNPSVMKSAGPDAPVESVNWEECQDFLAMLCIIEGVPDGTYRLLTEAEWEYCCRAGTHTPTYIGYCDTEGENNAPGLDRIAWYTGNSGVTYDEGWNSMEWPEKQYNHRKAGIHPVAKKIPNAWGLYDMLGNVWEWTADLYLPQYPVGPIRNPKGPELGSARVCRGGAWYTKPGRNRCAERYENSPLYRDSNLGFRIARKAPQL